MLTRYNAHFKVSFTKTTLPEPLPGTDTDEQRFENTFDIDFTVGDGETYSGELVKAIAILELTATERGYKDLSVDSLVCEIEE